nr:hypothetical protein [Chloroflexia bacterium]
MGQALVILIMVLALVAVLVAVHIDPRLGVEAPSFRDHPPPEPSRSTLVVLTSFEDEVGQDRQRLCNTWVDLVTQRLTPQPTVIDLSRPGLTLSNARETAHSATLAKPAAVLLWLIIAEFKNSPTLANYETTLDQLLTFLDDAGCRTVVA